MTPQRELALRCPSASGVSAGWTVRTDATSDWRAAVWMLDEANRKHASFPESDVV